MVRVSINKYTYVYHLHDVQYGTTGVPRFWCASTTEFQTHPRSNEAQHLMSEASVLPGKPSLCNGDEKMSEEDWLGVAAAAAFDEKHLSELASFLIELMTGNPTASKEQLELAVDRLISYGILIQLRQRWLPHIPEEAIFDEIAEEFLKMVLECPQGWTGIIPRAEGKKPLKYVKVRSNREGKRGPYNKSATGRQEDEGPRHVSTFARSSITYCFFLRHPAHAATKTQNQPSFVRGRCFR